LIGRVPAHSRSELFSAKPPATTSLPLYRRVVTGSFVLCTRILSTSAGHASIGRPDREPSAWLLFSQTRLAEVGAEIAAVGVDHLGRAFPGHCSRSTAPDAGSSSALRIIMLTPTFSLTRRLSSVGKARIRATPPPGTTSPSIAAPMVWSVSSTRAFYVRPTAICHGCHAHLTMAERRRTVMIRRVACQQIIRAPPKRRRSLIGVYSVPTNRTGSEPLSIGCVLRLGGASPKLAKYLCRWPRAVNFRGLFPM